MQKMLALVGDKTLTGGVVLDGTTNILCNGKGVAVLGSKVTCPVCIQGIGEIIEGANHCLFGNNGRPVAYDGCIVACGCPIGTNRVIASASNVFVGVTKNNNSYSFDNLSKTNLATTNVYAYSNNIENFASASNLNKKDTSNFTKEENDHLIRLIPKLINKDGTFINDNFAITELTPELKESYFNLLRKLYPEDFCDVKKHMITIELAQHLNKVALEINKCINRIDFLFNILEIGTIPAISFYKKCQAIKTFADNIALVATRKLKNQACINFALANYKSETALILKGL